MRQLVCSPDLRYQMVHAPGELRVFKEAQPLRHLPSANLPANPFAVARLGQVFFRRDTGILRNRAEHGQHYEPFALLPKDRPAVLGPVAVGNEGERVLFERRTPATGLSRLLARNETRELVLATLGRPDQLIYYSTQAPIEAFRWAASPGLDYLAVAERLKKGWRVQVIDPRARTIDSQRELSEEVSGLWVGDKGELLVQTDRLQLWSTSTSEPELMPLERPVLGFGGEWIALEVRQDGLPGYLVTRQGQVLETVLMDSQGGLVRTGRRR